MVSNDQAAADLVFAENKQMHLLKLPPETRNRIYELVLTPEGTCVISKTSRYRRPGLLQVCHRLRDETRLMYHEVNKFHVVLTRSNVDNIRRWAATITADELRKIQALSFHFELILRIPPQMFFDPTDIMCYPGIIGDFEEVVSSMLHRGLATNAIRVYDIMEMSFAVDGFLYVDTEPPQGCLIYACSTNERTLRLLPEKKIWAVQRDSIAYIARLAAKVKSEAVQSPQQVKYVDS